MKPPIPDLQASQDWDAAKLTNREEDVLKLIASAKIIARLPVL
jgi:DNA-binding CsgD family transcriptional regulator